MDATSRPNRTRTYAAVIVAAVIAISCGASSTAKPVVVDQPETTTTTLGLVDTTTTSSSTTSTTIPAPTMPATTAVPAEPGCWADLARQVGWPEDTLPKLSQIIMRESRCNPDAYADRPSTLDNSRGLLQINAYGSLADHIRIVCGIEPETLFDPATNLACALVYWQRSGWSPWRG